ncbi:MAG: hypothetical protein EBT09_09225, partial [Actinobacteria bacterium]|nr:hypothetical protein [Actinomycetota bacterium]
MVSSDTEAVSVVVSETDSTFAEVVSNALADAAGISTPAKTRAPRRRVTAEAKAAEAKAKADAEDEAEFQLLVLAEAKA